MDAEQILKFHDLKNTGCRKYIINVLMNSEIALSEHEFKSNLFDRVTFYRSLKTLEEKGIVHRIVLNNTTVKYAFNKIELNTFIHPHFHCVKCDDVLCLEACQTSSVDLPTGFSIDSAQVLLEGTCPNCKKI